MPRLQSLKTGDCLHFGVIATCLVLRLGGTRRARRRARGQWIVVHIADTTTVVHVFHPVDVAPIERNPFGAKYLSARRALYPSDRIGQGSCSWIANLVARRPRRNGPALPFLRPRASRREQGDEYEDSRAGQEGHGELQNPNGFRQTLEIGETRDVQQDSKYPFISFPEEDSCFEAVNPV